MKTTLTKKLLGLALSVFSITAVAQCPTITNMNVTLGANGTATVTPVLSSSTSTLTMYYWSVTATQTSGMFQSNGTFQFATNGSYNLFVLINDSISGCSITGNTTIIISNMSPASCNADFTAYTDSSCITHFMNGSTGSSLTFNWSIGGSTFTSYNPTFSLPNGTYPVTLLVYSGGAFCDSVHHVVTVSCGGGTVTPCQASFYTYTDSTCMTHFINSTPCTYTASSWNINGNMYYTSSPVLNLANGSYAATLNASILGGGVSAATNTINVSCNTGTTSPLGCQANASFYLTADSITAGNYFAYNLSTGSGALSYLWNFGDGTSSTQQYPFHQYAIPGQYVICLTVTGTYTNTFGGVSTCSDTYCDSSSVQRVAAGFQMSNITVLPQNVTGIKQTELVTGVKAFPNPIADELTIEAIAVDHSKLTFVLTDALGRMVSTGDLNNSKASINTSNLEKGFYSLSITNEKGDHLKTIKLVK